MLPRHARAVSKAGNTASYCPSRQVAHQPGGRGFFSGWRRVSGFAVIKGLTVLPFVDGVFRIPDIRGLGLRFPAAGVDLVGLFLGDRAGVFPLGRTIAGQCRQRCQPGPASSIRQITYRTFRTVVSFAGNV